MQNKTLQPYFLLALLGGAFYLAFHILHLFLAPLVLAVVFAVVLHPVFFRLTNIFGNRPSLASLATIILFAIVVLVPASFIASQLFVEAQQLYENASEQDPNAMIKPTFSSLLQKIADVFPGLTGILQQLLNNFDQYMRQGLNWVIENLGTAFSGLLMLLLSVFIFFVALYYLLRDGRKLTKRLIELSPLSDRDDTMIIDRLDNAIDSVLRGQLAIAFIQGIVAGLGFVIFGIPNAVLLGIIAAVAALIPTFGTALVLVPAVLYLGFSGSIGAAVGLAIWGAVAVGLIDNLLGPKFMSSGLQLHPLLVILAVIGGLSFYGAIGIILGPLTMSFLMVLLSLYRDILRGE